MTILRPVFEKQYDEGGTSILEEGLNKKSPYTIQHDARFTQSNGQRDYVQKILELKTPLNTSAKMDQKFLRMFNVTLLVGSLSSFGQLLAYSRGAQTQCAFVAVGDWYSRRVELNLIVIYRPGSRWD